MTRCAALLAAALAVLALCAAPTLARADFGFLPGAEGFEMAAEADGGQAATTAGSHPYRLRAKIAMRTSESPGQPGVSFPDGDLRDLRLELPMGLIANPAALPKCATDAFNTARSSPFEESRSGESCPADTQVGTAQLHTAAGGGVTRRFGLFNLVPAPGAPAELGFAPFGEPIILRAQLRPRPDGQYTLLLEAENFPQSLDVSALDLTVWGTPWAQSHDGERGNCLNEAEPAFPWAKCSVGPPATRPPKAFLTMPTTCTGPLTYAVTASSWQQAGSVSASDGSPDLRGCDELLFKPNVAGQLTNRKASSGSGFAFELQDSAEGLTAPSQRMSSQIRRLVLSLPEGVTINPSLGAGLEVCTPGQYAAETAFSSQGAGCPNGSKIGDFTVRTQLFEGSLEGAVYLAQPRQNPFGSLLALYLVARLPARGILVEVAGKLTPDPATGRLTASFEELPQFPYTDLGLRLREGQRPPLTTPAACGPAITQVELVPWLGPAAAKHTATTSQIETGIGGGPCPAGVPPFSPQVTAGGINSNVGSYTPFYLHMSRTDSEQEITSYSATFPKGITGRLAGLPFCPEAAIAAARSASGVGETVAPSCPAASQIGRTISGYGVGPALTYAPGRLYMAGPYHGQPLSVVAIDAATVGPFDLGTVVVRSAFSVDPETAQLKIDSRASDPIPHIIDGIPLHLRDVRVFADRPSFTRNPSSCAPSEVISTLGGSGARFGDLSDDTTATVSNHFQLLNCLTLGFRPKLGIRLRGPARRGAFPSLRATFASRGAQDSNLKMIEVTMPHSEFLAQGHIGTVCTRPQFAAERCPARSVYGAAAAFTPLFDEPLRGNVYLRSSSHRLPDLVASLRSGEVRIVLDGRIGSAKQGIRVRFEELPDAPIERFVLQMRGGRRGLLVNSANICASPPIATVKALGQNNLGAIFTTKLRGQCGKRK